MPATPAHPLYFDHAASAVPVLEALTAARRVLEHWPGNASALHRAGRSARAIVEEARTQVATALCRDEREVIFTSGGTESNNLAVFGGAAEGVGGAVSAVEHPSVLRAAQARFGPRLLLLDVDDQGRLRLDALQLALESGARFVSVMHVNNETGVVQPVAEVASLCRAHGAVFHCDASQGTPWALDALQSLDADLVTLSAHKIGGLPGTGALLARASLRLSPLLHGGSQERGRRAGSENLPGLAAFGAACNNLRRGWREESERVGALRNHFEAAAQQRIAGLEVNGGGAARAPHISNIAISGIEGEELLRALDAIGIFVSTGSACSSGESSASHVLLAMGQDHARARCALRVSFGRDHREEDSARLLDALESAVQRLRAQAE